MEKHFCKYHPVQPARWHCGACRLALCQECAGQAESEPVCAVCGQTMQRLDIQSQIPPFWQRMSTFFAFPASFPTALYLIAFAILSSFINLEIPGLVIGFVVYFLFINYAYTVLDLTTHGELEELHSSTGGFFYRPENAIKQLIMFFILAGLNFKAYDLAGFIGFQLSAILSLIILPAVSLQLVKHRSLFKMFSLREVRRTFVTMGKAYWILCLFLLMLFVAAQAVLTLIPASASDHMNLAVEHFVVFYFLLVALNMTGYSFYQFFDQLRLEVHRKASGFPVGENGALQSDNAKKVSVLIKEGYLHEAATVLQEEIRINPADLSSWQRYFRILLLEKDSESLERFSQEYINYLLHQDKDLEAMDIYLKVQGIVPAFRPKTGAQAYALANRLRAHGQAGLALNLLNNMHKHYRGYEGIAKAYMLAAQILCEQFGEDLKAKKILNFIIKKYPQSRYAHEATDYLKVVDQLAVR